MDKLVSTNWLYEHLGEPRLAIVDASWHMPATLRNAHQEYLAAHIPGARFHDLDEISDHSNKAPHMLPPQDDFGTAMERLGIARTDRIIVYDNSDLRTAARGWFMLRHFGAQHVAILDGGFQKWKAEGRPTENGETAQPAARFDVQVRPNVVTKEELLQGLGVPWLDARGRARFEGSEPDPRPGVAPGHAPGARSLPFASCYREDGTFKNPDELRQLFEEAGIDPLKPFVASCGSGVTANSLIFAAYLLGNDDARLYDGSWSEWGADPATPKLVGEV